MPHLQKKNKVSEEDKKGSKKKSMYHFLNLIVNKVAELTVLIPW